MAVYPYCLDSTGGRPWSAEQSKFAGPNIKSEISSPASSGGAVTVYCLAALIVEEACRSGCHAFAAALETNLSALLSSLPHDKQVEALRLSYELSLAGEAPSAPRLRLVYSRT